MNPLYMIEPPEQDPIQTNTFRKFALELTKPLMFSSPIKFINEVFYFFQSMDWY